MYSNTYYDKNIMTNLVIIKPKYHVVHFIKGNSFFNKIIGYNKINNIKGIINNY